MVTKTKKQDATGKSRKVKVNELKLNKETVKDLTDSEAGNIKGGVARPRSAGILCTEGCVPKTITIVA